MTTKEILYLTINDNEFSLKATIFLFYIDIHPLFLLSSFSMLF